VTFETQCITWQMRTYLLERRKREECNYELENVAHQRGLTCWREGSERSGFVSSETQHIAKWGLTCWRERRGRSRLVSLEMWHVANKDSLPRGEEEGGMGW
jgi:hypothetical protein